MLKGIFLCRNSYLHAERYIFYAEIAISMLKGIFRRLIDRPTQLFKKFPAFTEPKRAHAVI
jgi:hypothetical protein